MNVQLKKELKRMPVTSVLIGICVVVYLVAQFLTGDAAQLYLSGRLLVYPLAPGLVIIGPWWTLLTSMFMHGSVLHLACNMLSLYWMGRLMERLYGSLRFVLLYLVSGVAGGACYMLVHILTGQAGAAVGASGAIFGLFGAGAILFFLESRKPFFFPQSVSRMQLNSFFGLIVANVFISLTPGIAWEAHLGGLVAGALVGALMYWSFRRGATKRLRARAQAQTQTTSPLEP